MRRRSQEKGSAISKGLCNLFIQCCARARSRMCIKTTQKKSHIIAYPWHFGKQGHRYQFFFIETLKQAIVEGGSTEAREKMEDEEFTNASASASGVPLKEESPRRGLKVMEITEIICALSLPLSRICLSKLVDPSLTIFFLKGFRIRYSRVSNVRTVSN